MKIIGIGNKARQGKDTAAEILNKLIPNSYILHWADALYNECRNDNGTSSPLIYRFHEGYMIKDKANKYLFLSEHSENLNVKKAYYELHNSNIMKHKGQDISTYYFMNDKHAELLQWWGTYYRRNLYGDLYWIEQLFETMCSYSKTATCVPDDSFVFLIPDTRFKNEYNFIKRYNSIFIKIERYDDNNVRFVADDRDSNHPSETDLDEVEADYYFSNNSTLEMFKSTIEMFVKNDFEFIDFINGEKIENGSTTLMKCNKIKEEQK